MWGNDKEEWMEDLEVKPILTSKLQMKDKSLDDNCTSNKLMFHDVMDYEVQHKEFVIHKSKVGISVVLVIS